MTDIVRRHIEERPGAGRLGRHVEHDPRSWDYRFAAAPVPLKAVVWRRYGTAFDQGQLGSCTGNAVAGVLNTVPFHKSGELLKKEADAVKLYSEATVLDGAPGQYPPDDTGSSGNAACKAAKNDGLISGYQWTFSIDGALQALQHGPVITGVNWYSSFDTPDAHGLIKIGGEVRGGHEFEVNRYDPKTNLVGCWNSWGKWGVGGRFYMSVDTWAELLAEQGDVTIPLPL